MNSIMPWIALAAPLGLVATAFVGTGLSNSPRRFATLAIVAASAAFAGALVAGLGTAWYGPSRTGLLGSAGVGLSLQLDALAAIMLVLVSFVGLAVIRYSRNYLDGDPGHVRFTRWLVLALASVLTLLLAGNLALLLFAWIATSLSLHRLLLFYEARPAAQRAARKKYVASRLGDLCLLLAAVLLHRHFGTVEISDLAAASRQGGGADAPLAVVVAAFLVVATATLKSAQLPLHGWLIEVMETPTPVSALLHAGIVNAGGFLVLRLADVLVPAPSALGTLALVGGATALFGSLVMLTQTSIKVQLAYSTVAQMGFMLLQCGLGAFSSALLHIVAHSLYKAHAFLSSGSVMDLARASWTPSPGGQPHPARLAVALAGVTGLAVAVAATFGYAPRGNSAQIAFGSILLMGLVHLMSNAIDERPSFFVVARTGATALGVAILYFGLQAATERLVQGSLPAGHPVAGWMTSAIAVFVVLSFAALTVFQNQMMRHANSPFWTASYVHLRNGLYLNTLANRLVLAWWPRRAIAHPARAS